MAKPLISREQIFDEALRILDDQGAQGLTARNLAARLKCSTSTLYQQVGPREQMLHGLVAHAFAQAELSPGQMTSWPDAVRSWCAQVRSTLLSRPELAGLMTLPDSEILVRFAGRLTRALREHGFAEGDAVHIAATLNHLATSMVMGEIKAGTTWNFAPIFDTAIEWAIAGIERSSASPSTQ